jgi:flagellar FliL protein
MADKDDGKKDDQGAEAKGKGGNKKRLIIMVILGLLIVGLSIGGTLMALKLMAPPPVAEVVDGESVAEVEPPPKSAIYYPLQPAIVVNFQVKGRQRFLQAELTLMTRDDSVISEIETHLPMIRNSLVLLIGGQVYDEIQTAEGKELLRQHCLQELQRILEAEIGKPGIEQVLFTNFVMQ